MTDPNEMKLGETCGEIEFSTLTENRNILLNMTSQTRHSISLFTHDLEPRLYDDRIFIQHIKRIALSSRHAIIRILIKDPEKAVKHGHRIIETARRFTSNIKVHRISDDYRDWHEAFIILDECGWIWRKIATLPEGRASFCRTLRTRDLVQQFDLAWNESTPDPEIRALHI